MHLALLAAHPLQVFTGIRASWGGGMKITTVVITGARRELETFILESIPSFLPPDEGFFLLRRRGADEALAHADRIMPLQEQYFIRDMLRTKAQLAWQGGVRRCLIMGGVSCVRNAPGFEECEQFVRRELYEVNRWHLFDDIGLACVTPKPEIVMLC